MQPPPSPAPAEPTPGAPEVQSLTAARGVAALWVVAFHFWPDVLRLFPSAEVFSPIAQRGQNAVPFFFILSGYVLELNYASRFERLTAGAYQGFLGRRLGRIYPVHLATLLVVLAMVGVSRAAGWRLTDGGYTAGTFVENLLLLHAWEPYFTLSWNYPSWSISAEWFAYLWFPVACRLIAATSRSAARFAVAAAACLLAAICVYAFWEDLPARELARVAPTFLLGVFLFHATAGRRKPGRLLAYAPEAAVLLLVLALYRAGDLALIVALLGGFAALVYALARLGPGCSPLWTNPAAVSLGRVSYPVYMAHTLAQKVCYKLLPVARYADASLATRAGVLALYAAAIAAFCGATYYLVEQPFHRALRHRRAPRPGVSRALAATASETAPHPP